MTGAEVGTTGGGAARSAMEPVAIVGIGCRFPGANDPRAFWALLREGRCSVRELDAARAASVGAPALRGGFLDRVDGFDWRAFRIPPREARALDPQHRLLLEVAWEAFEDAGLELEELAGSRAGVHVGIGWNDYLRMLCADPEALDGYAATGNLFSFGANRISFIFDLRGPSEALDAACASSLMSVLAACRCLRSGETDLALAGGVHLALAPDTDRILGRAGILSRHGQCRVLDSGADGVVRGEGAGLVVLKRLSDVKPTDRVYALIRGGAASHNGRNGWIMAPSAAAQAELIRRALAAGGVSPEDVDYVELHGAATLRGDATEAQALAEALGPGRGRACRVGSVKTNIGALEAAGGVAGLIKVALAIHHRELPPTLHLERVNPDVALDRLALRPVRELERWPDHGAGPVAGVTATGLGGANAHLVLSGAPAQVRPGRVAGAAAARVVPLSALDGAALEARALQVASLLEGAAGSQALLDISYTLCERRTHHRFRIAAVGARGADVAADLRALVRGEATSRAFRDEVGASEGPAIPATRGTGLEALATLSALHVRGAPVSWTPLFEGESPRVADLPAYPWQRERLWMRGATGPADAADATSSWAAGARPPGGAALAEVHPHPVSPEQASPDVVSPGQAFADPASPALASPGSASPDVRIADLARLPVAGRHPRLVALIRRGVAEALGVDEASIGDGQLFFDLGVTSISALAIRAGLCETLGMELPSTVVFDHPTLERLARFVAARLNGAEPPDTRETPETPGRDAAADEASGLASRVAALSEEEAQALLLERLGLGTAE